MDIMRSAYSADMRFFPDQPERLVGVTWYRVPDDRPFLPYPHAFASRVWEYQKNDDPPYGEKNLPRPWRGGQTPATAGDGGVCGTPDEWLNGCKPDAEIPPPWPGSAVCSKCAAPKLLAIGGSGTGGTVPDSPGCFPDLNVPVTFQAVFQGPADGGLSIGFAVGMNKGVGPCLLTGSETTQAFSDPFVWFGDTVRLYWGCTNTGSPPLQFLYVQADVDCSLPSGNSGLFPYSSVPFWVQASTDNIFGGPWPPGHFDWRLQPTPP